MYCIRQAYSSQIQYLSNSLNHNYWKYWDCNLYWDASKFSWFKPFEGIPGRHFIICGNSAPNHRKPIHPIMMVWECSDVQFVTKPFLTDNPGTVLCIRCCRNSTRNQSILLRGCMVAKTIWRHRIHKLWLHLCNFFPQCLFICLICMLWKCSWTV